MTYLEWLEAEAQYMAVPWPVPKETQDRFDAACAEREQRLWKEQGGRIGGRQRDPGPGSRQA